MVMAVMMVAKRRHADQVYQQPRRAHNKQLSKPLRLSALHNPLACLDHDFDADQDQKNTITKTTQSLDFAKPVWEPLTRRPLAGHGSKEPNRQSHAVKEHVNTVAKKTKRVGHVTIKGLDHHKGKIQTVQAGISKVVLPFDNEEIVARTT